MPRLKVGYELWKLPAGSREPIAFDINPGIAESRPTFLTPLNNTLYFRAYDSTHGTELWKIDPTTGQPVRLTDTPDPVMVPQQSSFSVRN